MIPINVTTGKDPEEDLYFKRWHFGDFSIVCYSRNPVKSGCIDKEAEKLADTIDPNNMPTHGYRTKCPKNT